MFEIPIVFNVMICKKNNLFSRAKYFIISKETFLSLLDAQGKLETSKTLHNPN